MKVIGLIGYTDKYDFAINIAKAINLMEKSVLVIDATLDRKLKYVIPALDNVGRYYITQYDNIDFAVGFNSMHDVENYMIGQNIKLEKYDYVLIDMDSPKSYELFRTRGLDKIYFFVETSVLSVEKNKDIVKALRIYNQNEKIKMSKVIYRSYISRAASDYFDKKIAGYGVEWNEPIYEIPLEDTDKIVSIDSQFGGYIDIKRHTKVYIANLADLAAEIMENVNSKEIITQIKRRKI